MIDPASIPEFTGDLEQLDKDISGLRGDAITIRDGGMHAHSRFQMLEAFYTAPEADQLFASTWPAAVKADAFAGDLETVADALDTFAYEIRPLVKRLKQLKADAFAFVDSVEGDDDWTEDEGKVDRHQQLWDGVNAAVAAFQEAERKASTTISGLVGGPKFVADDGSHTHNRKQVMYGYDLDSLEQAKELPWGSPVSQTYDALDFGHHFKSFVWDGLIVDNIWGGLKGLKTLTGLDGGDAAGKAWGHLGDVVGGVGQYTIKPYDAFMDWAFGEDQDSPEETRQKQAAKDFGKSLVAWDMWSENPARASATVVFNALTLGTVPAARAIKGGKAGAAAQGAAKIGEYLDPLSAAFKVGGKAASSLPKLSELTATIHALDNAPGTHRLHSQIELSDGSKVRIEDGAFIRLDADGNPVHDTPRQEPRADQRASQHEAAPAQREPAAVGGHSRAESMHSGSASGEGAGPASDKAPDRKHHDSPNSSTSRDVPHSSGHTETGDSRPGSGGSASGGHDSDLMPDHSSEGGDTAKTPPEGDPSGASSTERVNDPPPEMTAAQRAAHWTHLEEVEKRSTGDFDHLQRDPDKNGGISEPSKDEARVGLDLREQGRLPDDIRRPVEADRGEFYSPSTGKYYDIKGVHSDWPPFNNVRDKSQSFRGAYNPANNGKWVKKLSEQIVEKRRTVIIDVRNANQAAIDDVKSIVQRNGWEDHVIWYP
ncbi:hypothetical protein PS467_32490 [Streptomyces luomodiensis]|uniref:Uncharacterized protein n=2 Tax=Streptomyces luomodiensis TaxID=3026192 RepID=A0ABY9VDT2_9ACTN|nr:hypothetical protein [Streptomyces sp. SCA4-21]WNF01764.1 hypothetical protein PS467_32490 [Streptomyces sp. SCA4-21]